MVIELTHLRMPHQLLLSWLLLIVTVAAAVFVGWEQGLLATLYRSDRSYIAWVISIILLLVMVHGGWRAARLSLELTRADVARQRYSQHSAEALISPATAMSLNEQLPTSAMKDYLQAWLDNRTTVQEDDGVTASELIRTYEYQLKSPQEIGWLASDVMLKLGLVGTIVGFIMMLSSVAGIEDFDVSTMQGVLQLMSGGMATALYTTLTGITASMLAGFQYYMLDKSANHIIDSMRHITHARIDKTAQTR